MSEGFIDTLARPPFGGIRAPGAGRSRPAGRLPQRQITGWMDRWEKAKTDEVPLMNKLGAWFLENIPPAQPACPAA